MGLPSQGGTSSRGVCIQGVLLQGGGSASRGSALGRSLSSGGSASRRGLPPGGVCIWGGGRGWAGQTPRTKKAGGKHPAGMLSFLFSVYAKCGCC